MQFEASQKQTEAYRISEPASCMIQPFIEVKHVMLDGPVGEGELNCTMHILKRALTILLSKTRQVCGPIQAESCPTNVTFHSKSILRQANIYGSNQRQYLRNG